MTRQAATAYACVAYRMMEQEGEEASEESLALLMEILYDFYTVPEIQKIVQQNIYFDSYEAVINKEFIKRKIKE